MTPRIQSSLALVSVLRLTRTLTVSVALAALLPVSTSAQTAAESSSPTRTVAFGLVDGRFVLTLPRNDANEIEVRRDGRDVLLRFGQAAPAFDAAELQARAAGWLDAVNVGYDSVLLRLSPGVDVQVPPTGPAVLSLQFIRSAAPSAEAATTPSAGVTGAQRLDLLRARMLLQEGSLTEARERFGTLRGTLPDSPEPLTGLAAVESETGRWRRSLALYREALAIRPGEMSLQQAAAAVGQAHAGGLRMDVERRRSRGGDAAAPVTLDLAGIEASRRWDEAWKLGVELDSLSLQTESVQRADGALRPFSGQRTVIALSAQHDALDGAVHSATLFAGNGSGGLGLLRRQIDDLGNTSLVVEFRRPYVDQVEAIVERAQRDRFSVARRHRLAPSLNARAELGLNRYRLPDAGGVARSTTLGGEVRWADIGPLAGLSAIYVLDAEYVNNLQERALAAGGTYAPLPLLDREVHSLLLDYAGLPTWQLAGGPLRLGVQLGAGVDRYGRSGPIAAASLSWARQAIVVQLRASHIRNIGRSRGITDGVAASVSIPL